jgi:hypothetical protein
VSRLSVDLRPLRESRDLRLLYTGRVTSQLGSAIVGPLPALPASAEGSYHRLLGSVARLIVTEPLLRRRMALGAVRFASFQLLWTALPFMLASPPHPATPRRRSGCSVC